MFDKSTQTPEYSLQTILKANKRLYTLKFRILCIPQIRKNLSLHLST